MKGLSSLAEKSASSGSKFKTHVHSMQLVICCEQKGGQCVGGWDRCIWPEIENSMVVNASAKRVTKRPIYERIGKIGVVDEQELWQHRKGRCN